MSQYKSLLQRVGPCCACSDGNTPEQDEDGRPCINVNNHDSSVCPSSTTAYTACRSLHHQEVDTPLLAALMLQTGWALVRKVGSVRVLVSGMYLSFVMYLR